MTAAVEHIISLYTLYCKYFSVIVGETNIVNSIGHLFANSSFGLIELRKHGVN